MDLILCGWNINLLRSPSTLMRLFKDLTGLLEYFFYCSNSESESESSFRTLRSSSNLSEIGNLSYAVLPGCDGYTDESIVLLSSFQS